MTLTDSDVRWVERRLDGLCRRVGVPAWEFEDTVQEAWVDVMRNVRIFDPDRGVPLRVFIGMRLRYCVIDAIRRLAHGRRVTTRPRFHALDLTEECSAAPHDYCGAERAEVVSGFMRGVEGRDLKILRLIQRGELKKDIAVEIGVSKARVTQLVASLRGRFEEMVA